MRRKNPFMFAWRCFVCGKFTHDYRYPRFYLVFGKLRGSIVTRVCCGKINCEEQLSGKVRSAGTGIHRIDLRMCVWLLGARFVAANIQRDFGSEYRRAFMVALRDSCVGLTPAARRKARRLRMAPPAARTEIPREKQAKVRKPIAARLRYWVMQRDGHRCVLCGADATQTTLHLDHIVPVCRGGENTEANLRTTCADCNLGKGALAA